MAAARLGLVTLALVREYKDKEGKAYTTTWFDMFRIANGKIVEHWDVLQTIPDPSEAKNDNGMF